MEERIQQIAFDEIDARGNAVARGVAARHFECSGGNVCSDDARAGQFVRQRDGDAAGACAHIRDAKFSIAALGESASGGITQAFEGDFNHMFGFGARNQDIGRDFEIQAPEFLMSGEMLCRYAARAPRDQRKISARAPPRRVHFPDARKSRRGLSQRMHQQQLSGQPCGRHVFTFELRDGVAQSGKERLLIGDW